MAIMNDYLILLSHLCKRLTDLHWFYSPRYFKNSIVDLNSIDIIKANGLEPIIVLDRNIFSRLYNVSTKGRTNQGNIEDIAALMSFCALKSCYILPYYAINEYATGRGNECDAQKEFDVFSKIFECISFNVWVALAIGGETENKQLISAGSDFSETKFDENSIDYLSNYAALLHFAYVWKQATDPFERFKLFFEWYYDHMKVSRYMVTYISSVLASCGGYLPPKKINNNSFMNVVEGCQNQARDISYLTSTSLDRIDYDRYEYILVTDDHMLGLLFSDGCYNTEPLRVFERNIKKGNKKASKWVDELLNKHIEFEADDYYQYCYELVEIEYHRLKSLFPDSNPHNA